MSPKLEPHYPAALVLPPYISSTGTTPHLDDSTVNHLSYLDSSDVLPSYESRIYDRLWDGVSYGGLDISALNTPITLSRRTSAENLRELNRMTMPHPEDLEAGLHRALQERNAEDPESSHDTSSEDLNVTCVHKWFNHANTLCTNYETTKFSTIDRYH